jgi:hypothetical protein
MGFAARGKLEEYLVNCGVEDVSSLNINKTRYSRIGYDPLHLYSSLE